MAGRIVRWGAVLGLGGLWWWSVLRLALAPDAGVLEGAVAAAWMGAEPASGALCGEVAGGGGRWVRSVVGGVAGAQGCSGARGAREACAGCAVRVRHPVS